MSDVRSSNPSMATRVSARASGAQLDQTVQQTDEVGLDVSFRTNADSVTAQYMSPLLKLGALAASMPQARLRNFRTIRSA